MKNCALVGSIYTLWLKQVFVSFSIIKFCLFVCFSFSHVRVLEMSCLLLPLADLLSLPEVST